MEARFEAVLDQVRQLEIRDAYEDVIALARIRDAVDKQIAECARVISDEKLYEGVFSPVALLRQDAHLATGAAMAAVAVGNAIERLPLTIAAMGAGEVGFMHLALMASAEGDLGEAFDEAALLAKARKQTVTDFRRTVEHAVHASNPQHFAEKELRSRERRFLKLSPAEDGSLWLKGWLEPEGASLVRAALEPLARPDGYDDRRRDQRLGDALVELASEGVTAELIVTVPVETMLAIQGAPAAETEWGGLLSSESVRRLLCDATVRRLVLDSAGMVIDYGRRRRLFNPNSKKAMVARDGRCRFPWCDRPARWCEGHHLKEFAKGGGTSVNDGLLLCRRHHHLVHEAGWQLVSDGDGVVAVPPWRGIVRPPPFAAA